MINKEDCNLINKFNNENTNSAEKGKTTFFNKNTSVMKNNNILFLFDVDGTLSPSRAVAPPEILHMLSELRKRVQIGFVGGSDLPKQKEQLGENVLEMFDYGFPENGVQFYKKNKLISSESIIEYLEKYKNVYIDEDKLVKCNINSELKYNTQIKEYLNTNQPVYTRIVNYILFLLSKTDSFIKTGNFIELRHSMINISPIGRSCTREQRNEFFEFDKKEKIRQTLCKYFDRDLKLYNLKASIGGQISIDLYPESWNKTYCLNHINNNTIVFFGDMTSEGGNDYELFNHERVIGNTVKNPADTIKQVNEQLKKLGIEIIKYE